jgi:3-oxoacyl-[acyl-carrier protein] reductase
MDLGIRGRIALIAGGSAGMGKAAALTLAGEGADIVLSARGEARLLVAAAEIAAATGARVTPVVADHSTPGGRATLAAACPHADILVISVSPPAAVEDFRAITEADWLGSVTSGLVGPVELIRHFSEGMAARRWGRVVAIATVAAKYPSETRLLSGPARSALVNYCAAVGRRLARDNVAINCLLPGMVATDGLERTLSALAEKNGLDRAGAEALFAKQMRIAARRVGTADEVGKVVAMLCGDFAGYVVGQSLVVDGGMTNALF